MDIQDRQTPFGVFKCHPKLVVYWDDGRFAWREDVPPEDFSGWWTYLWYKNLPIGKPPIAGWGINLEYAPKIHQWYVSVGFFSRPGRYPLIDQIIFQENVDSESAAMSSIVRGIEKFKQELIWPLDSFLRSAKIPLKEGDPWWTRLDRCIIPHESHEEPSVEGLQRG